MSAFFDENKPAELVVLPSLKHISRNPAKLFGVVEEALRRGMALVTNNVCVQPGRVSRRDTCVQYNDLDVSWCVDEALDLSGLAAKPGRNDPCPCGSGKKYKRCCGA
jgi:hypothetical protein